MDTKNNKLVNINTEEYQYLIDDCRSIIGQRIKNSRMEVITAYAEVGERIVNDKLYKKSGKGNQIFLDKLFEDVGIGKTNGYYAINFYEKYFQGKVKDVSTGVETIMMANFEKEGENISWNKIKTLYLPEPKKTETPELPKGKWQVLYIDPPWAYDVDLSEGATRSPTNNYPVMDLEELKKFGEIVKRVSTSNCTLFMWITAPKLNWMNDVLEAWGFDYKTNLIWDKVKPNMGHYSSVRHEILVIAGKGKCAPTCDGKTIQSVDSVVSIEKSTRHSEKPLEFMDIIDKLYPDYKKLEMFARNKGQRKNWSYWGNEANE